MSNDGILTQLSNFLHNSPQFSTTYPHSPQFDTILKPCQILVSNLVELRRMMTHSVRLCRFLSKAQRRLSCHILSHYVDFCPILAHFFRQKLTTVRILSIFLRIFRHILTHFFRCRSVSNFMSDCVEACRIMYVSRGTISTISDTILHNLCFTWNICRAMSNYVEACRCRNLSMSYFVELDFCRCRIMTMSNAVDLSNYVCFTWNNFDIKRHNICFTWNIANFVESCRFLYVSRGTFEPPRGILSNAVDLAFFVELCRILSRLVVFHVGL